jgi:DNA transformation protein
MSELIRHLLELMQPWAPVTARAMFGGHGLYRDSQMFALVANDTLYLKVDAQTQARFAAAGSTPFIYQSTNRRIEMSYWSAPTECLEEAAAMRDWCQLAYAAALRATAGKRPPTPRLTSKRRAAPKFP